MAEFFSMGGYGAYVWPSYLMTVVVMLVLLLVSLRGLKTTEATFERLKGEQLGGKTGPNKNTGKESANGDEA